MPKLTPKEKAKLMRRLRTKEEKMLKVPLHRSRAWLQHKYAVTLRAMKRSYYAHEYAKMRKARKLALLEGK